MKKLFIFAIAMMMILNLVGCANPALPQDTAPAQNAESVNTAKIEVMDFKGRSIVLDKVPQKIVSLSPSNTEILFALGAGERVVGVTSYCDYPEEAKKVEKVGTFDGPNMELIKKVQPDVVLAGYIQEELIKTLEDMGIPVIVTEAESFEAIYQSIGLIGEITGTDAKAEEIVAGMKNKIAEIEAKTKDKEKPTIFYVVWTDPLTTAGSKTYINDVIKVAGGINVAEKVESWANYSAEELIKDNPDMLVAALHSTDEGMTKEDISKNQIFSKLECVKQGKIHVCLMIM
ncbi:MAG: ABC transporter substrate-binding protein [Clostridiaceae bacterium]|nr:ABC transporter substrate-binding protein [Clostridiaceae bacterium]